MVTSQKLTPPNSPISTVLLAASLAKHLASLESAVVLKIPEGRYSLTLPEYLKQNNLGSSSLKTSKDFLVTTTAILSKPSSLRLMSWGTTVNGKCLTARITESPKTENALSLSDILEEHPDPKYFLSEQMTARILGYRDTFQTPLPQDTKALRQLERTSVKVNSMHKKPVSVA